MEDNQHGGVQGLRWYVARQVQDQHGDYANEFLDGDQAPTAGSGAAAGAGASSAAAVAAATEGALQAGGKERGSGGGSRSEAASRAAAAAMARAAGKGGASTQGGHQRTAQASKQLQVTAVERGNVVLGH
ncbi:hypothetical protein HXX76_005477 [Chlamydomonas incerta]|uniref:Uncharacterized protein n=1 Tax=Chlamydomonas incerta TaxID=51695 RepID=A0A835T2Y8_CHLIN|nr:hypothetical protein HXX76_005477 [Chlamydomonas incerta]|eukprot:KAG2437859.1 hypothetical protein HXX76_005477 [Chlamydomonas incerta]